MTTIDQITWNTETLENDERTSLDWAKLPGVILPKDPNNINFLEYFKERPQLSEHCKFKLRYRYT